MTTVDDDVEVAVRGNGSRIPDRERAVLLDGNESPLQHGSSVGLWFVNWRLSRLGGELRFQGSDDAGSLVIISISDRS